MSGPGHSQDLRQRQIQSTVLAPQLRQSLKILQVAALDLHSVIQEELESNPTLEEMPMEGVSLERSADEKNAAEAGDDGVKTVAGSAENADEKREQMDFSKEFEIFGKLDEDWRDYPSSANGASSFTTEDAERRQHFWDSLVTETSLQEHLMGQAELIEISPQALVAMRHLVGSLDDRGFLTQAPAAVALQTGLPLASVQEALALLRTFDPIGIGAQTLSECLLIQLAAQGRSE